ncbi:intersectin-EH binding protein Ibp1 [Mycobacterium sp. OTB74]|uniref:intersectin-EH binding protein Ibp1 n=1 Tax=Mycobacterium sp. OTB74 TaxID=1853452 RepID=UPI0024747392|nr:intersectin-EH binding protein Ibp1 [Mycobacterium sp. OTB74]MDH6243812.1 hypothetical protein [Mycobacterium sp. OTB74]
MAPTSIRRMLVAGGFTIVTAAAPVLFALSGPAATSWQGKTNCPPGTTVDTISGQCFQVGAQQNAAPQVQPPQEPGPFGSIDGIPCNGQNTGTCLALSENQPPVVQPHSTVSSSP